MIEFGYLIGWIGLCFGVLVPLPQIHKILKKKQDGVSLGTYVLLCLALTCYLIHAIYISSPVFMAAQGLNLCTNGVILVLLLRRK